MKVLVLAPFPIPYSRGSSLKVLEASELLAKSKEVKKLTLISFKSPDTMKLNHIEHRPIPLIYTATGMSIKRMLCDLLLLWYTLKVLRREKYDLIHAHNTEAGFIAVVSKRIFRIPVLLDMHGDMRAEMHATKSIPTYIFGSMFLKLEDYVFNSVDHIITITQIWADYLKAQGLMHVTAVHSSSNIPDVFEDKNLRKKLELGSEKVVMYSGNFRSYQGIDLLIDAATEVVNKYKNIKFVLIGNTEKEKYEVKIEERNLQEYFIFTGFLPSEILPHYYQIADILVIPRKKNRLTDFAIPRKLTDYMAAGKPIIATDVSDHKQILGKAGMIINFDVGELSEAILYLLKNDEASKKMGEKALKRLREKFSWEQSVNKILKIYSNIILPMDT